MASPAPRASRDPLRIAVVIPGVAGGLGMIHAKKLVRAVEAQPGVETLVTYLTPGLHPLRLASELAGIWRSLRAFRPDVVHGHYGGKTGLVTVVVAALVGARSVIHFRGSDLNPAPVDGWLRSTATNLLSRLACLAADHRIFVSRRLVDRVWLARAMGDAWEVRPSGHDEAVFRPGDRAQARERLGLDAEVPVLAFVAGANPAVKGEPLVQQVVELLRPRLAFEFVRVGGDWAPDRVASLMQAADCLVFASPFEGSPCVVQEALACGLAIVSVDVGDVADLAGGSGAVDVVARDPAALAAAVERRLAHPARVPTPEAVRRSGFAASAPEIVETYRRLASPGGTGRRLVRGVSWTAIGNLAAAGATLLATLGLARMLGPEALGEFGLVQNTLGFFAVLIGPSLGLTATRAVAELRVRDPARLARILRLTSSATYGITLAAAAALALGAGPLARDVLRAPDVVAHLRVAALALLLMVVNGVQVGVLAGFEAFRAVAVVNAVRGATVLPAYWLGGWAAGSLGSVWGLALSWGAACVASGWVVGRVLRDHGIPRDPPGAWSERGVLVGFSLPGWLGGVLVGAANWTGSVILARQPDGIAETGILNAANQLFLLLMFVPQVLGQAGLPVLMERAGAGDAEGARAVLGRLVRAALLVTVPGAVVIMALGPFIMGRLGPGFAPHWPVLWASVATVPLYALGLVGMNLLLARSRMRATVALNLVYLLAFVGGAWGLRGHGAMGFALARLLAYAVLATLVFQVIGRPGATAAQRSP